MCFRVSRSQTSCFQRRKNFWENKTLKNKFQKVIQVKLELPLQTQACKWVNCLSCSCLQRLFPWKLVNQQPYQFFFGCFFNGAKADKQAEVMSNTGHLRKKLNRDNISEEEKMLSSQRIRAFGSESLHFKKGKEIVFRKKIFLKRKRIFSGKNLFKKRKKSIYLGIA